MKEYIVVVPLVSRDYELPFTGYDGGETSDNDGSHIGNYRGTYIFYKKVSGKEEARKEYERATILANNRLYASRLMKSYRVMLHNITDDQVIDSHPYELNELFDGVVCSNKTLREYDIPV